MSITNKYKTKLIFVTLAAALLFITACSSDNNPVDSQGNMAKVEGRLSPSGASGNVLGKSSSAESVQGATVMLAQIQADGSLKTVSNNSVQTDASGRFVLETNLNGVSNLVVVASQGSTQWKAIVSGTVQSGTTVYAPPLDDESTAETEIYIKLVGQGRASTIDAAELKILLNAQAAANVRGNASAQDEVIAALQAQSDAYVRAAGNSYFGLSSSQIQAFLHAKAEAQAKLDAAFYHNSSDTEDKRDSEINDYDSEVLSASASSNVNASVYAELMRIGASAFVNATASMSTEGRLAIAKSIYKRYSFVLTLAMKQQFQAAGASDAQVNALNSAGANLYASVKSASDLSQIDDAFVQFHSSAVAQLKLSLSTYATVFDSINASVGASSTTKALLKASLASTISIDAIVNAYVTFFSSVKAAVSAGMTGATSAQMNAVSQIFILASMN